MPIPSAKIKLRVLRHEFGMGGVMGIVWRLLAGAGLIAAGLAGVLVAYLYWTYGGGEAYPDLTGAPIIPAERIETVVTSPEPIGNVAVSRTGRIFYTIHPESRPEGVKLYEWKDGRAVPFPEERMQSALFDTPLGVRIDAQDRLWVIDHGSHGSGTPQLLAFDINTGELVHEHKFEGDIAPFGSFLQDMAVDQKGETVFIADVSYFRRTPAIVVYDVRSATARRVLQNHPSVVAQNWLIRTQTRAMSFYGGILNLKTGIDGIALGANDEWVYFAAMNHARLYRVRASDLTDAELSDQELADRLKDMGPKPLTDGISTDALGGVFLTDVQHGAIMRRNPDGGLVTVVKAPEKIRWADALSFGPGTSLYIADSAIPDQMLQSKEHIRARGPYYIYRIDAGVAGVPGR